MEIKIDNEKVCLKRDEIQFSKSENKRPHGFLKKKKIYQKKKITWQPRFSSKHHSNKKKKKIINTHSKINVKSFKENLTVVTNTEVTLQQHSQFSKNNPVSKHLRLDEHCGYYGEAW